MTLPISATCVPVRLSVGGGYPFAETVEITVAVKQPVEFPLYLRVPGWARQPMVYLPDGEIMQVRAGESACAGHKWVNGDVIRLEMPAAPRVTRWYHQSGAVEFGPLVMALKAQEEWRETEDGLCADTQDAWNRALVRDERVANVNLEDMYREVFGGRSDAQC